MLTRYFKRKQWCLVDWSTQMCFWLDWVQCVRRQVTYLKHMIFGVSSEYREAQSDTSPKHFVPAV